jgi:hypothetical protein
VLQKQKGKAACQKPCPTSEIFRLGNSLFEKRKTPYEGKRYIIIILQKYARLTLGLALIKLGESENPLDLISSRSRNRL